MQSIHRTTLRAGIFCLAALATPASAAVDAACAQLIKDNRVSVIVPHKPGGGYDSYGRVLATALEQTFGGQVVVSNIAEGAGIAGLRAVSDLRGGPMTIGVTSSNTLISGDSWDAGEWPEYEEFIPLGVFATEYTAWSAVPGKDIFGASDAPLVIPVTTIDSHLVRAGLVGTLIGRKVRIVAGYKGTNESAEAALRGEGDLYSSSMQTAVKKSEGGDFEIIMVLADREQPEAPGVPYFAGAGGIIDQLTRDKPAAERERAMRLAHATVAMTTTSRSIIASAALVEPYRSCLIAGVDQVLFSELLAKSMVDFKLEYAPVNGEAAEALNRATIEAYDENGEFLDELMAEIKAN